MPSVLLLTILVAALIALIPVWRLRLAGWPARWLFAAWVTLAVGTFVAIRFPGPVRFLVPILVLCYLAPFVAGPERLTRVLSGREPRGVVIDVTPRVAPGLPPPDDARHAATPPTDDEAPDEGGRSSDEGGVPPGA